MDMKTAVIYRLEELIRQKDITVNVGVVTIKKLCDGLEITIPEFFGDSIFAELEPEL